MGRAERVGRFAAGAAAKGTVVDGSAVLDGDISSDDVLELITPKMIQDSFEECKRDLGSDIISIEECYDEDTYCCP